MSLAAAAGSCPVCGARDASLLRADCRDHFRGGSRRWKLVSCTRCGLVRTEPRPTAAQLASFYDATYFDYVLGARGPDDRRRLVERAYELIVAALNVPYRLRYGSSAVPCPPHPGARMLDIGPGSGIELRDYARRGWEVWAVEPSEVAARAAAERARIPAARMIVRNAEDADLPEHHFDRVVLSHVIEHLIDPRRALEHIRATMRPHAVLVLRCPNFGSLERRLFGRWWAGLDVPRHLQHFSRGTLTSLLDDVGLRVVRARPQLDYSTPLISLGLWAHHGRGGYAGAHTRLSFACLPLIALARVLGAAGTIELDVQRR